VFVDRDRGGGRRTGETCNPFEPEQRRVHELDHHERRR
jgi:hypothetical protein